MVLDLLWLSANSKHNLTAEGTPEPFVWSVPWNNYPQNNILLVTLPLPPKLPPFTLLVLLSFHASQKLSVRVAEKQKQNSLRFACV